MSALWHDHTARVMAALGAKLPLSQVCVRPLARSDNRAAYALLASIPAIPLAATKRLIESGRFPPGGNDRSARQVAGVGGAVARLGREVEEPGLFMVCKMCKMRPGTWQSRGSAG